MSQDSSTSDWGIGADYVIDLWGPLTIPQSTREASQGGLVSVIG